MTTQCCDKKSKNYHHGNLRNALIVAAVELIQETGSADFAMVDAARRAGVSSAAPYRHFKDKDALLEAVCELGFLGLSLKSVEVRSRYAPGSRDAIIAMGKCYIHYVIERPQFYDLMWGDHGMRSLDVEQAKMQASGFYGLVETVQQWCEAEGLVDTDPLEIAVKLWCVGHGIAGLAMHGHIERFLEEYNVDDLLESSTQALLDGLLGEREQP